MKQGKYVGQKAHTSVLRRQRMEYLPRLSPRRESPVMAAVRKAFEAAREKERRA